MASAGSLDPQNVAAKVKTLVNAQLKTILRKEGLAVSGVKATMQERIITHLFGYARSGDVDGFNRVKALVYNPDTTPSNLPRTFHNSTLTPATQPQAPITGGAVRLPNSFAPVMPSTAYAHARPNFKDSPFYSIVEPLTPVLECKDIDQPNSVRENTRDTLECKITLKQSVTEKLLNTTLNLKAMVYCASDPISPFSKVDIAFPHQVEIKVNLDEVKANLRGLKNKPGSTRPADITYMLRKRPGYDNSMTVTYALTTKKFYIVVNLVEQIPPEELVKKLKTGKSISKEQVIREMISKAQDSDIVATSSIMSLKCPLSTLRIDIPCRSTICTHNQCFDALSFLQLQEQAPTWTCPVCNKIISFEALEVDQYVNDILRSTPSSVDQVTIEPNGEWSQVSPNEGSSNPKARSGAHSESDEDDDLIEIHDMPRLAAIKDEAVFTPGSMTRTPPYSSREQSTASAAPRSVNGKRPIGQVIDLTFSSDEEDQPVRAPKRQSSQIEPRVPPHAYSTSTDGPGALSDRLNGTSFNLPKLNPARPPSGPPNYAFDVSR
ncbi:MAG: hypothetical protein Q9187_000462 [Circinaria calcarea]